MSVESSIYDLSLISSKHNQTKQTHIHENIEVEKDTKFRESNPCKSKSVFSHPKIMIKKKYKNLIGTLTKKKFVISV